MEQFTVQITHMFSSLVTTLHQTPGSQPKQSVPEVSNLNNSNDDSGKLFEQESSENKRRDKTDTPHEQQKSKNGKRNMENTISFTSQRNMNRRIQFLKHLCIKEEKCFTINVSKRWYQLARLWNWEYYQKVLGKRDANWGAQQESWVSTALITLTTSCSPQFKSGFQTAVVKRKLPAERLRSQQFNHFILHKLSGEKFLVQQQNQEPPLSIVRSWWHSKT